MLTDLVGGCVGSWAGGRTGKPTTGSCWAASPEENQFWDLGASHGLYSGAGEEISDLPGSQVINSRPNYKSKLNIIITERGDPVLSD